MARQKWTNERVLDEIRGLYKREALINSDFVQKNYSKLYFAAMRHFGGWKQAVVAAGFPYKGRTRAGGKKVFWTRERIVERILEIHRTEGKVNYQFVFSRWPVVCVSARKQFGTYRAAVEAAGFNYEEIREKKPVRGNQTSRYWTRERIIDEIKWRFKSGLPIDYKALKSQDQGLLAGANRYLGGLPKALRLAGFDPKEVNSHRWTKQKVVKEIQSLFQLGSPLHHTFILRNRPNLFKAAWRHWQGWAEAVSVAGFNYEEVKLVRRNYWSKKKVLKEIKRLERTGYRLNVKAMHAQHGGLFGTACVLFGSWDQAVEAAGINYQDHCTVWSTKAWLRKLSKADVVKLKRRADALHRLRKKHERKKR